MHKITATAVLLASLALAPAAQAADSYAFGNRVLTVGDSVGRLVELAGTPVHKDVVENEYGASGIGVSVASSPVMTNASAVFGPPLWYCPVEWRYRGPTPNVVATCARARMPERISAIAVSTSGDAGRYDRKAT